MVTHGLAIDFAQSSSAESIWVKKTLTIESLAGTIHRKIHLIQRRIDYYNHDIARRYILGDVFVLSHQLKYVTNIVLPVGAAAQPLLHLAIAANRMTAFALPLTNSALWRPRRIVVVLVVVMLLSLLLGTSGPLWLAIRRWQCPTASRTMAKTVVGLNRVCQLYGTGPDQLRVSAFFPGYSVFIVSLSLSFQIQGRERLGNLFLRQRLDSEVLDTLGTKSKGRQTSPASLTVPLNGTARSVK